MTLKEEREKYKKVVKRINNGVKTAESYGTGLACEKVLVSTFNLMTIAQLEQMRYILNQIIKKKKIYKKINEHDNTLNTRKTG